MKIDPACPIDLIDYEILTDDRGNARAYIRLRNTTKRALDRLSATVVWYDGAGETFATSLEAYDLEAAPGRRFTITASTDRPRFAVSLDVLFSLIAFDGGERVWKGDRDRLRDTPPQPKATGEELKRLALRAGEDAVAFPVKTDDIWMCVCAKANAFRKSRCSRCGRLRDEVFDSFTKDVVMSGPKPEDKPLNVTLPIDDTHYAKRDWRDDMIRERKFLIRRTITMLALIILIALAALLWRR
ncbi:MAG: hypothetical protein Q4D04_15955, partial [Clostridia bacterium]|nr:hypothetical protein [Clostridia bacterium]